MTTENWLQHIIETESPGDNIEAFFFGRFEDSEFGYVMYLIGSSNYDPEDAEWACNVDFEPTNKYLALGIALDAMQWEDILELTAGSLKTFTTTELFKRSFFSKAKGIATGFDDGDWVTIYNKV